MSTAPPWNHAVGMPQGTSDHDAERAAPEKTDDLRRRLHGFIQRTRDNLSTLAQVLEQSQRPASTVAFNATLTPRTPDTPSIPVADEPPPASVHPVPTGSKDSEREAANRDGSDPSDRLSAIKQRLADQLRAREVDESGDDA